ncbi:hypothetical protein LK459_15065 [Gordonia otitidis]|uniref:hypothetical protein n=1 Tax=Gordonia otitidis TaxID=249058 RepID=UPI001D1544C8|nr:hypothetical protein [Gordonia otitidis]UEA57917.1 hypothetical protein LK459_15065 [Gordonia otitidis]
MNHADRPTTLWSAALLAASAAAGVSVLATWVRAQGSVIPASTDLTQQTVNRAGAPEELAARGVAGVAGAVVLVVACLLAAVALWSVSPTYRRGRAGYSAIGICAIGIAAVLWFRLDPDQQLATLGGAVDVRSDSVEVAVWPWVTLCCLSIACIVGVMLVPRAASSAMASDEAALVGR